MRYKTGIIEDPVLAEEMAYAEYPFRELQQLAAVHGLADVVADMDLRARRASYELMKAHHKRLGDQRYRELLTEHHGVVVEKSHFIVANGRDSGGKVWAYLVRKLQADEIGEIPLQLHKIADDEQVITGDLKTAAWGLGQTRMGLVLAKVRETYFGDLNS